MALSYRVLFRTIVGLTSLETAVGYLNKYEKKYDHLRLQEAVLGCFKGSLLSQIKAIADFEKTWLDLDRLMRVSISGGLKPEHNKILTSYCSAEDHGRWRGFGETTVIDLGATQLERDTVFEYTNVFENERGMKAMASEVWEDLQIGLFSSVWDVVSGREEILECTADSDYCRNLFVVGHRRQVYCDPLCRKSEGMRKLRNKNKLREAEEAENVIRV